MSGMRMTELSHYIGLFSSLRVLDLERNRLKTLPSTLQLCQNLEELLICDNSFCSLPGFLLHMPNLRRLSRHNNRFHNSYNKEPKPVVGNQKPLLVVDTLLTLSSINVARHLQLHTSKDIDLIEIPKILRYKVYQMFQNVSYCNFCRKGIITEREGKFYFKLIQTQTV